MPQSHGNSGNTVWLVPWVCNLTSLESYLCLLEAGDPFQDIGHPCAYLITFKSQSDGVLLRGRHLSHRSHTSGNRLEMRSLLS